MASEQSDRRLGPAHQSVLLVFSAVAGLMLVWAAFKFDSLNWVLDGPGWLVSRFTSIDFHEGEGAFGFLLAIFLAWLWTSAVAYLLARLVWFFRLQSQARPSGPAM